MVALLAIGVAGCNKDPYAGAWLMKHPDIGLVTAELCHDGSIIGPDGTTDTSVKWRREGDHAILIRTSDGKIESLMRLLGRDRLIIQSAEPPFGGMEAERVR